MRYLAAAVLLLAACSSNADDSYARNRCATIDILLNREATSADLYDLEGTMDEVADLHAEADRLDCP